MRIVCKDAGKLEMQVLDVPIISIGGDAEFLCRLDGRHQLDAFGFVHVAIRSFEPCRQLIVRAEEIEQTADVVFAGQCLGDVAVCPVKF